ncbi:MULTISPECIES: heme exporter protein CcmD [Roseobacter]|uniref:Heme exporter protein D n=1 Tax=Roseobacter litoralis (strain ATCC 49566 / DSM 6996 / JCM 21268 / NBRC 15278 / OCh 149) TaxID=391595 RepID=F7ZKX6_ROSLO|nr:MULTISPECIES: heme exporter protein CcmD [Roseobacter]AEI93987.1 heme exporter protein D [Roseobacter litoralis Och 149]GIT85923.1 hypothetical protein ROBYS_09390 [Roseobacter sp. OBYS 0001]
MMPDLGKYSEAVLSSYAATLLLLALLVFITLHRGRKARRALDEIERKRDRDA